MGWISGPRGIGPLASKEHLMFLCITIGQKIWLKIDLQPMANLFGEIIVIS